MSGKADIQMVHEVIGDIHVIKANYQATDGRDSRLSVIRAILRFLVVAAREICRQRAVFEMTKVTETGAMVDLNLCIRVRPVDAVPTICEPWVPRDSVSQAV